MFEHVQREIWQKATDMLIPVYSATNKFPKDELQSQMNQLRAAAVGIVLNLTEMLSCETDCDLQQFIESSLRSVHDCLAGLKVAQALHVCPPKEIDELMARVDEIGHMLNNLSRSQQPATS